MEIKKMEDLLTQVKDELVIAFKEGKFEYIGSTRYNVTVRMHGKSFDFWMANGSRCVEVNNLQLLKFDAEDKELIYKAILPHYVEGLKSLIEVRLTKDELEIQDKIQTLSKEL